MVTLAQRIEALRTEANLSRPALAAALHFPKGALEKFETGRQTPTKEQQAKIAAYFGVSLFYLRGESNDRTRQEDWMDMDAGEKGFVPAPAAAPRRRFPVGKALCRGCRVKRAARCPLCLFIFLQCLRGFLF